MAEENLIEYVRAYKCLYNNKSKGYKDITLKQAAWEQIGAELKLEASECKNKWNQLRNAFLHAMTRRKTVTGQGAKNFKKWKYEDEMSFLLPFMVPRDTLSNIDSSERNHDSLTSRIDEKEYSNEDDAQHKNNKSKQNYQKNKLQMKKIKSRRQEKDDIDLLFQSMAKTVKKFPKSEQIKLKFDIMKLIYEVEVRCLENEKQTNASSTGISMATTASPSPPFPIHQSPSADHTHNNPPISSPQVIHQSNFANSYNIGPLSSVQMGTLVASSSSSDIAIKAESPSPPCIISNQKELPASSHLAKSLTYILPDTATASCSTPLTYVNLYSPNTETINSEEECSNPEIKPSIFYI